jgi:hypothetical protein
MFAKMVDRLVQYANMLIQEEQVMDQLLELVHKYCEQRNLIKDAYIQGMTSGKDLDAKTVATLIRYHKEWMR